MASHELDRNDLMAKLCAMNMMEMTGSTQFLSMNDILNKMSATKRRHTADKSITITTSRDSSPSSQKRVGSKSGHSRSLPQVGSVASIGSTSSKSKSVFSRPHSVASFRSKTPSWDNALHLSDEVSKSIHRIPDRDPTGKYIKFITRDDIPGDITWNHPVEYDRNFPPLSPKLLSPTYRKTLAKQMDELILKAERDFVSLPSATDKLRKVKANTGRDLMNLKQERSSIFQDESKSLFKYSR